MTSLNVDPSLRRYRALIGTGGIGTGVFFTINDNETLGREESRSGRFLNRRDYCKLHIIAHYICVLMDPDFATVLISKVGEDETGRQLIAEMKKDGLDTHLVQTMPGENTLYSFCFLYPDGSGGNLTIDDSACAKVDPRFIREAESQFAAYAGEGIALAAPEVPLNARLELLKLGEKYNFLKAASFTSEEMRDAKEAETLANVDLLALNLHEAAMLAGVSFEEAPEFVVEAAIEVLLQISSSIQVSITAGVHGSWVWDGEKLKYAPIYPVEVAGTAGAGDAHFSGILTGLAAGLSLDEAHDLGVLIAALSVTSGHTISKDISRESLKVFADTQNASLSPSVRKLLES